MRGGRRLLWGVTAIVLGLIFLLALVLPSQFWWFALPAFTLMHAQGESLWELARRYHSSLAAIENANPGRAAGEMLLIPRA